jgi:hypothetical protein
MSLWDKFFLAGIIGTFLFFAVSVGWLSQDARRKD